MKRTFTFAIITASATSLFLAFLAPSTTAQELSPTAPKSTNQEDNQWIQLFNGKNLNGWTPKIRGCEMGENWNDTFRVENGVLKVSYDKYENFDRRFGHLFYKDSFSNYILKVEYRFTGDQIKGGPGWAFRNSGLMIHGQDPVTMGKDQNFPASIEVQLLGGNGKGERTNLNLCTPGTNVVMNEKLIKRHCTNSTSKTYHGDQWVTVEVEVRGNKVIRHKIDGKIVLEYNQPQLDPTDPLAAGLVKNENLQLTGGTISLQSESHPCEFRKVELKILHE